jgi:hypothetical protein
MRGQSQSETLCDREVQSLLPISRVWYRNAYSTHRALIPGTMGRSRVRRVESCVESRLMAVKCRHSVAKSQILKGKGRGRSYYSIPGVPLAAGEESRSP